MPDPREHPVEGRKGICAAGSCPHCGCSFRKPSDVLYHRCAAMQEAESAPPVREGLGAEERWTLYRDTFRKSVGAWQAVPTGRDAAENAEIRAYYEEQPYREVVDLVSASSLADLQAEIERLNSLPIKDDSGRGRDQLPHLPVLERAQRAERRAADLQAERDDARAQVNAIYEAALEAMRHPLTDPETQFEHILGTMGHGYVIEGTAAMLKERDQLQGAVANVCGQMKAAAEEEELRGDHGTAQTLRDWIIELNLAEPGDE